MFREHKGSIEMHNEASSNEMIRFQKSEKENVSGTNRRSTQVTFSKLSRYYTDPSVCPWQGKKIGVESSEVTKKDEGTRTATHGGNLFVPSSERPLSRPSSPDESSSTRPTRFAEPLLLLTSSHLAFVPRIFLPRTEQEKEQERKHRPPTRESFQKPILRYTVYTHRCPCRVYIAAIPSWKKLPNNVEPDV